VASVCCLTASIMYCLAVFVAVEMVSIGLHVVLRLPAAVWLGVVVTIDHVHVSPGCLSPRIFSM